MRRDQPHRHPPRLEVRGLKGSWFRVYLVCLKYPVINVPLKRDRPLTIWYIYSLCGSLATLGRASYKVLRLWALITDVSGL